MRHRSLLEAHTYCLCDGLVCNDASNNKQDEGHTYSQPNILVLGGEMRRCNLGVRRLLHWHMTVDLRMSDV